MSRQQQEAPAPETIIHKRTGETLVEADYPLFAMNRFLSARKLQFETTAAADKKTATVPRTYSK